MSGRATMPESDTDEVMHIGWGFDATETLCGIELLPEPSDPPAGGYPPFCKECWRLACERDQAGGPPKPTDAELHAALELQGLAAERMSE